MFDSNSHERRAIVVSAAVILLAALILLRAAPIVGTHFQTLGPCLHPIATRGPAALYRVDPIKPDCSAGDGGREVHSPRAANSPK